MQSVSLKSAIIDFHSSVEAGLEFIAQPCYGVSADSVLFYLEGNYLYVHLVKVVI